MPYQRGKPMEWNIVQRLRDGRTNGSNLLWSVTAIHREAADEIERLRAENERLSQRVQLFERVGERTSLRCDDLENQKEELREENEQFRKVLRSIACTDADCSCVKPFGSPVEHCVHGKARAALGTISVTPPERSQDLYNLADKWDD